MNKQGAQKSVLMISELAFMFIIITLIGLVVQAYTKYIFTINIKIINIHTQHLVLSG